MSVTDNIVDIMRDKAADRRNSIGDHWGDCWCDNAADEIERLRAEVKDLENQIDDIYLDLAGEDV